MQCLICGKCGMILQKNKIHTRFNVLLYAFHLPLSRKISSGAWHEHCSFIVETSIGFRQSQLLSLRHMFWYCENCSCHTKAKAHWALMVLKLAQQLEYMINFLDFVMCHLPSLNHGMKGRSCWCDAAILLKNLIICMFLLLATEVNHPIRTQTVSFLGALLKTKDWRHMHATW